MFLCYIFILFLHLSLMNLYYRYCKILCTENTDCIYCDICEHWNHLKCTKLSKKKFKTLLVNDEAFYCQICISEILPFTSLTSPNFYKMLNNVNHNIHTVSYLCFVCQNKCANSHKLNKFRSIQCNGCHHWAHQICSGFSEQKFKCADMVMQKYFCNKCLIDFLSFYTLSNFELLKLSYNSLHKGSKRLTGLSHPQYIDLDNFKSDSMTFLFINIFSTTHNYQ